MKTSQEIVAHLKASAPTGAAKGQLVDWFKAEAEQVISGLASSVDEPTVEAALKDVWDSVVVPNDGIPDFLDARIWRWIVAPAIKRAYAALVNPPAPATAG